MRAVSALAASDTPALLKTRLTLPCSARTKSAHANTASRSATSSRRVLTRTPCCAQAAAVPRPDVVDVGECDLAAAPRELDREAAAHA